MFDVVNTRSFTTEDEARAFVIANQCDPSPNNIAHAGTSYVVIDPTSRPDLWKGRKVATDVVGASIDALTDRVAYLETLTQEQVNLLARQMADLESEMANLRTEFRESNA